MSNSEHSDSDSIDVPALEVDYSALQYPSPNRQFFVEQAKAKIVQQDDEEMEYDPAEQYENNVYLSVSSVYQYLYLMETIEEYGIELAFNEKWQGVFRQKGNNRKPKKKKEQYEQEVSSDEDQEKENDKEKRKRLPVLHVFTERKITRKARVFGVRSSDLAMFKVENYDVLYFIHKFVFLFFLYILLTIFLLYFPLYFPCYFPAVIWLQIQMQE